MSSSRTTEPALSCVVCGSTESPQRCSACKVEIYCSQGCMKLHWILHKGLCGRPTDACYYPPLSKDDQVMLRRAQDFPFIDGRIKSPSFLAHVHKIKLWDKDLETLITQLSLPPTSCPIPEPRRSFLLAYTRNHLSESISADFSISTAQTGTFAFRSASVWRHLSLHIIGFLDDSFNTAPEMVRKSNWDSPALDIFRSMNNYLRQIALLSALWTWSSPYPAPPALTNKVLDYVLERKRAAIEGVDAPEMWKERLRAMHESNREMNEKAKGWLTTPYHYV